MPANPATLDALRTRLGDLSVSEFREQTRVVVPAGELFDVMRQLKEELQFDLLVDVTCVDYLNARDATNRYGLVYLLANTITSERITLRAFLNDPTPEIASVVPLWKGADWLEREVYDMFGIVFQGHPDLRRILMPEEFSAYPLRKDYPLQGRGERHNFPTIGRSDA